MKKSVEFRGFFAVPAALLFAVTVMAAGPVTGTAWAQNAAPGAQGKTADVQRFSEKELQSYASAAVMVRKISKNARDQMQANTDGKGADDIQKKAQQDAVAAVKQEGLTVRKYNEIAVAMRSDPAVRDKVLDYVKKLQ